MTTSPTATDPLCIVCRCEIDEKLARCPACAAEYHEECWEYNGGCGVYGCASAAETEGLSSLEIPASHWGREDKDCPRCGTSILAAAKRCKNCGETFRSADPQDAKSYGKQKRLESEVPVAKKTAILLLVLSLIPCTAPLAAVGGSIWLLSQASTIRKLPPITAALGKIAVVIAWFQTILFAAVIFLNQFLQA